MSNNPALKVTVMPAGHGDSVLVQCAEFNILVDSGPHDLQIHHAVRRALSDALGGQAIDLAIVTHYDDDHIGGLERMLKDTTIPIHALLFNSPLRIQTYIDDHCDEEVAASARQALDVAIKLAPCNSSAVVAGKTYKFFDDRVVLTALSPRKEDILKYGARTLASIEGEEYAGSRGRVTPICGLVKDLLLARDDQHEEDKSKSNLMSLAFILTFENRSILFLGDSWPSRVISSLAELPDAGPRIPLDLVFVSHHGSKKNNTAELHRHFDTARYVVSTDGKQNPDIETFGCVLRAATRPPHEIQFYFSEDTPQLDTMFSESDINVNFPKTGPLTFDL